MEKTLPSVTRTTAVNNDDEVVLQMELASGGRSQRIRIIPIPIILMVSSSPDQQAAARFMSMRAGMIIDSSQAVTQSKKQRLQQS